PETACEAYAIMLHKVENRYPDAEIFCMTSTARRNPDYEDNYADTGQPTEYSAELHEIAERFGFEIIDLENCIPKEAEEFDRYMGDKRAHPNALGMDQITNEVLSVMLGRTAEICHVTAEKGVVKEQAVLLGGSYSSEAELPNGYSVVVTMDGKDITDEVCEDDKIVIKEVTGDIEIGLRREAKNFRWQLNNDEFDSADEKGFASNMLNLLEGSIDNGWFSGVKYSLQDEIYLYHDKPWIIEWACTGDWDATLFANVKTGGVKGAEFLFRSGSEYELLAFGEYDGNKYHNYGIPMSELKLDMSQRHVYRLENKISKTGNMVWLYIDDQEIGPMNRYFIGSKTDTGITSDWISGRDFAFGYMGTVVRPINNCSLEYLNVWEDGHSHVYENGVCAVCGAEHPNLDVFDGKVISILSASTSTFAGYIPVADGFNLEHRARYPQSNLLTDVNDTWWMQVIDALDAKLGINDSWAGSQVLNTRDTNSGDLGPDAAMASLTRIQNLGSNGTPDLILFFGGGNDMGRSVKLGTFDSDTAPEKVDLTTTKWGSFAEAYVAAIMRLQYFYPETEIIAMTSYPMPSYVTANKLDTYGPVIKDICDHYGVKYLDLRDCGVTFDMLPDDIHPNAEGMDYITEAVIDRLLNDVEMESGEHVVHSVTHKLTNVKASLGHWKGISSETKFVETLSGTGNLDVSVSMGGKDITATAYADGIVTIPKVSGDVVITAKGSFTADGYLQQLPEDICAGTNIWTVLEPENIYYTVNGWGLFSNQPNVHSVTFPVEEGERIWATSFGSTSINGMSANGTRITWFDETGVLETVARNVVYAEFAKNGYITVPEGASSVNIPMNDASEDWEIYLLDREHDYGKWVEVTAPTCTAKGQESRDCANCDKYEVRDVHALGHALKKYSAKAATCTEKGWNAYEECTRCDYTTYKEL
ncbi:MAG: SGNH/GDSL hydrolase family protein, partial [Firmicutes bacterium]|nr:SGNH/GDSL hydrolase family protein [Bacillota bacterium]